MRHSAIAAAAFFSFATVAPALTLIEPYSSPLNDYNYNTDAAERIAVLARSEADFANARILVSEKRKGRWSTPAPISFSDPRYSDSDPWLTSDGKTLYFVSNRTPGGDKPKSDLDIWRAERTAAGWSTPEHLAAVASPGPELGVELHGDTLYFSSVRKGGKGGLDIYAARRDRDRFGAPALVDGPFNSTASDSDFTLSRDGRRAAFWRSVEGKGVLHLAECTARGWSPPTALPTAFNPGAFNFTPHFSADGSRLWFASTAIRDGQPEGMADIHLAALPKARRTAHRCPMTGMATAAQGLQNPR